MAPLFNLLFIVLIASSNSSPVQKETRVTPEDYRLPEGVIGGEIRYDLELSLGENLFDDDTFTGTLKLSFDVVKDTNEIKIHAGKYVTIQTLTLTDQAGEDITVTRNYENTTEIWTLSASEDLQNGNTYTLNFAYTAALITEDMYGFYKSSYKTKDGDDVYLGTTQFQATYARRAFPCFDEPSFKATFDIKIRHLQKYNALGNTVSTRVDDPNDSNFAITTFGRTPVMSTYLIAFIVSDFTCDSSLVARVPHQICSRNDTKAARELALNIGPKVLDALIEYTQVPYTNEQLTKIDQAAIPDFAAGAMENWGLATYRETGLLWDELESSNRNKQSAVTVIAHELTHMWFGNLVTTHWWSDTFLNEGFARFFQYFAANQVEELKSWELTKQFTIEQIQAILQSDAQKTSRPLSYPAFTPAEVSNRFASVSYNKGASVIRMVQHFMGAENFQKGINNYLTANQFSNVEPGDLWGRLGESAAGTLPPGQTLETVMKNWVELAGFPLLTVTTQGSSVVVTQKRFYTDGSPEIATEKWFVPITYTTLSDSNKFGDTSTKLWLTPDDPSVTIPLNNANDWIILNNQQVGYYRIQYDDALWEKISEALNKDNFDGIIDLNRAQLVDDIYNLAKANIKSHADVLDFYQFLKEDTSYYPWYSAFTGFSTMVQRTDNELIRTALSEYILGLMGNLLKALPFDVDDNNDQIYTLNKVLAQTWACRLGQEECISKSIAAYKAYKETKTRPSKNLRAIIYCNAIRNSDNPEDDWDFLWEEYLVSELATEKVTIASALGCARDINVLTGYLEKSINASSGIKQQDALSVFSAVYSNNPEGVEIAFDFLIENYKLISAYYGSMNSLNSLINGLTGRFTKQAQVDKLQQFLDTAEDLSASLVASATAAIENAKANIKLIEDFETELKLYFEIDDENESTASSDSSSSSVAPTGSTDTPTTEPNGAAEFKLKFSLFNVVVYVFTYLAVLHCY